MTGAFSLGAVLLALAAVLFALALVLQVLAVGLAPTAAVFQTLTLVFEVLAFALVADRFLMLPALLQVVPAVLQVFALMFLPLTLVLQVFTAALLLRAPVLEGGLMVRMLPGPGHHLLLPVFGSLYGRLRRLRCRLGRCLPDQEPGPQERYRRNQCELLDSLVHTLAISFAHGQ